jgi:hypothetical protein
MPNFRKQTAIMAKSTASVNCKLRQDNGTRELDSFLTIPLLCSHGFERGLYEQAFMPGTRRRAPEYHVTLRPVAVPNTGCSIFDTNNDGSQGPS